MMQIQLIPFIPETASYQIWHPKEFLINEDDDGIVTLASPVSDSHLTLSSYHANQHVTEAMLIDFLSDKTKNDAPHSEVKSVITDSRIWLEREFRRDNIYWLWWALSHSNQIILASINSENMLTAEDRHLYTYMIDKMEIYTTTGDD